MVDSVLKTFEVVYCKQDVIIFYRKQRVENCELDSKEGEHKRF